MSAIKLKSITTGSGYSREAEVIINVSGDFDRSNGLEQDLKLTRNDQGKWSATIALDGFPLKDTPEEAVLRLSQWLKLLSKSLNHTQIKKLNLTKVLSSLNF